MIDIMERIVGIWNMELAKSMWIEVVSLTAIGGRETKPAVRTICLIKRLPEQHGDFTSIKKLNSVSLEWMAFSGRFQVRMCQWSTFAWVFYSLSVNELEPIPRGI